MWVFLACTELSQICEWGILCFREKKQVYGGFIMTERYNENEFADVFMVLKLKQKGKDADRL